jgi:hypothetical protein
MSDVETSAPREINVEMVWCLWCNPFPKFADENHTVLISVHKTNGGAIKALRKYTSDYLMPEAKAHIWIDMYPLKE